MTAPTDKDTTALAAALSGAMSEALSQALLPQLIGVVRGIGELNEGLAMTWHQLKRIANALEAMAAGEQDPDDAPDMEMPLETFAGFDWSSISAQVVAYDEFGPTIVQFGGKSFKRRSPDNAYNPAVWFSRCIGKDEAGKNLYVRLITFKPMSDGVQPMGRKVEKAIAATPAQAQPSAATTQRAAPASQAPVAARTTAAPPAHVSAPAAPAAAAPTDGTTADQLFDEMRSASQDARITPRPEPTIGPKITGGARAEQPGLEDDGEPDPPLALCANCGERLAPIGQFCRECTAQQPRPATTAAVTQADANACTQCGLDHSGIDASKRQATIALPGAGGATFRTWAKDFAHKYPHYRIAGGEDANMYHITLTIASLKHSAVTPENVDTVCAQLERYAAAHHPATGGRA